MKIQNVKGGYDFLPKEQRIRDYINNILKETFEEYGFYNIETPILCYYDMLADKYDEIAQNIWEMLDDIKNGKKPKLDLINNYLDDDYYDTSGNRANTR